MNRVVLSGLVVFIAACADVVGPAPETMLDSGLLVDSGLVDSGLPDTGPPPPPCPIGHCGQTDYSKLYTLDEALRLGTVDAYATPWTAREFEPTIDQINNLGPGAVIELGFSYGGPSLDFQKYTAGIADKIRAKLPRTLLGTRFPEHLAIGLGHYPKRDLMCDGGVEPEQFDHTKMVGQVYSQDSNYAWIDYTKPETKRYILCLAKFYIKNGFTMLGFTNPSDIMANSANRYAQRDAILAIIGELRVYARYLPVPPKLYWGGDVESTYEFRTDYAFQPMRVFDNQHWSEQWNKRIERPGVGIGHSYHLSLRMIDDMKGRLNPLANTRILFYVDNYDYLHDDLGRFMELDATNRRFMMLESVRIAKENGVFVSLPLTLCEGCYKAVPVDTCQITTKSDPNNPSGPPLNITSYNALACGDFPAIQDALRMTTSQQIVTRLNGPNTGVNMYSLWSPVTIAKGDCKGNVIYHLNLNPVTPFIGPNSIGDSGKVNYTIAPSGNCEAIAEKNLASIVTPIESVNEWGICANNIQTTQCGMNNTQTQGRCIWHNGTNLAYKFTSADVGKRVTIIYSRDASGECKAEDIYLNP